MMLFFNIFFTSFPALFLGLFEKDLPETSLMEMPELFRQLKTGYLFNYKTTFRWFLHAVWHSVGKSMWSYNY
jgi:phospholipid-translocating ATPase